MDKAEACRILNLSTDPSPTLEEIKHSYHELARKYHTDRNPDGVAKDAFQLIDRAYKFLTTDEGKKEEEKKQKQKPSPPPVTTTSSHYTYPFDPMLQKKIDELCHLGYHSNEADPINVDQLRSIATKNKIEVTEMSHRSHKPVNKKKQQLFEEIQKLRQYGDLKSKSYDELVKMCKVKNISVVHGVTGRGNPKSLYELIADLMDS